MGTVLQKLLGGPGPLIEIETGGACSSQCCDEVVSEVSSSSSSSHHTHASWHEKSREQERNICDSGSFAQVQAVLANPGEPQVMKF